MVKRHPWQDVLSSLRKLLRRRIEVPRIQVKMKDLILPTRREFSTSSGLEEPWRPRDQVETEEPSSPQRGGEPPAVVERQGIDGW